jgi:hypothetical protein
MRLNLPKLLITTFWIIFAAALGHELHRSWGAVGYIVGFPAGFAGAFMLTWAVIVGRILVLYPFPVCRQGKCRGFRQFAWRLGTIHGWEEWGLHRYRCQCGDQYIRRGRRFNQLLPDGKELPYKRLVGFRTWADGAGG